MRSIAISGILFLCLAAGAAAGYAAEAETPAVRSVTLYPSGARFVFEARPDADGSFAFALPGAFDAPRVRAVDPSKVSFFKAVFIENSAAWEKRRSPVVAQRREIEEITARLNAIERTENMLEIPSTEKFINAKDRIAYIEESEKMRIRVTTEKLALRAREEEARKKLEILEREYQEGLPYNFEYLTRVEGRAAPDTVVEVEAFTHDAGWYTAYSMNLDSKSGKIQVRTSARARQNTGLDFSGELAFQTRQPAYSVSYPTLTPMIVRLRPEEAPKPVQAPRIQASMVSNQAMFDMALPAPEAKQIVERSSTLADVSLKGQGHLKGDGREEDFPVESLELSSTPMLIAIPEQSSEAWIVASMDSLPRALLPGPAELAVDGMGTGGFYIPEYGLGQTRIPFGMAMGLTVRKKPLVSKQGSSWIGSGLLEDGYTLEITNGTGEPRIVILRDRLPVPADDSVTLTVGKMDPAPAERDRDNLLSWTVEINPGDTKRITVEYTLKFPGGKELQFFP